MAAKKGSSKKVSAEIGKVYEATGIKDSDESGEWLSDYCHEQARSFTDEWARDNELDETPQEVYDAVLYKIEENAGKDLWEHQRAWLLEAIELSYQAAQHAVSAPQAIDSVDEEKGIVSVVIHKPFLETGRYGELAKVAEKALKESKG